MSRVEAIAARRSDPLGIDTALPLRETYHPAGFLLNIATNTRDVLEAAREAWGHCPAQIYPADALEFRVMVQPGGEICGMPVHRAQGRLYSVVSDTDNFASLDLESLRASMVVSERTAADRFRLRWCFVESLAYMLLAQRYVVPVHAACVASGGRGILLCGPTQAGKSTLAYGCARAGWAYLSDDAVFLLPDSAERIAIGRHRQFRFRPDAPRLFPELERFAARARPNGKLSIEVPVDELPHVRQAESAPAGALVWLERRQIATARLEAIPAREVLIRMLDDMPSYGAEVNAMHERTIRRLEEVPAFHLCYGEWSAAVECLGRLA